MNLYELETSDGEEWHVAADSPSEAIEHLISEDIIDHIQEVESTREVPQSEWKDITVVFDEVDEVDEDTGEQIRIPMEELMKNQTETQIMCSTAWLTYI